MKRLTGMPPILVSTASVIILVLWMMSGYFSSGAREQQPSQQAPLQQQMMVQTMESIAKPVQQEIIIQGQLDPLREVRLRAETASRVAGVNVEKGQRIGTGDVILTLEMNDRRAQLEEMRAKVVHLKTKLAATRKLQGKGYTDEVTVMDIEASLASANADMERIEIDIRNTEIRAPFDGVVNERNVEIGDYVQVGDVVAVLVDDAIMRASGYLPQQSIGKIRPGQDAVVRLVTGEEFTGRVTYLSVVSDNESRTYRVEVEIPNADRALTAGISTMLKLSIGEAAGHFISPSILSMGMHDELGVKVMDENNVVVFYPVTILRTQADGLWVTGLPERANLITLGQGFVTPGEKVTPAGDAPSRTETIIL